MRRIDLFQFRNTSTTRSLLLQVLLFTRSLLLQVFVLTRSILLLVALLNRSLLFLVPLFRRFCEVILIYFTSWTILLQVTLTTTMKAQQIVMHRHIFVLEIVTRTFAWISKPFPIIWTLTGMIGKQFWRCAPFERFVQFFFDTDQVPLQLIISLQGNSKFCFSSV